MIICCLGDSLTEGDYGVFGKSGIANVHSENYPYFLSKLSGAQVKNYGRCGFRATKYLEYYKSGAVDVQDSDIIIIMLGTNGGHDPKQDTPDNEAYKELVALCKRDAPTVQILLCTPPHTTENPAMSNCGYAPQVALAVDFVRKFAQQENIKLIDVAACEKFNANTEHIYQSNDGLHFNQLGYKALADYIYQSALCEN